MNTAPMTMHALILLTTSMTWVAAPAQSVPDSTAIPMVADVFVLGGSGMQQAQAMGLAQWQSMLHSSKLLKNDLSDHAQEQVSRQRSSIEVFSAQVSFRLRGPAHMNRSGTYLRAGFAHEAHSGARLSLARQVSMPYDTLTSAQTGSITLVDSVYSSRYDISHSHRQLMVDVSVIFLKEFAGRWALYGGAGATVGAAYGSIGRIEHKEDRFISPAAVAGGQWKGTGERTEEISTKDELVFGFYVPLGVSYRLGTHRAFWRAMNLCYELRPSVAQGGAPYAYTGLHTAVKHMFGLRVDLAR